MSQSRGNYYRCGSRRSGRDTAAVITAAQNAVFIVGKLRTVRYTDNVRGELHRTGCKASNFKSVKSGELHDSIYCDSATVRGIITERIISENGAVEASRVKCFI